MQDRKVHSRRFVWLTGIALIPATRVIGQECFPAGLAAGVPSATTVLELATSGALLSDLFPHKVVSNSKECPNDR